MEHEKVQQDQSRRALIRATSGRGALWTMLAPCSRSGGIGCNSRAVSRWLKLYREKGIKAFQYKRVSKKPAPLSHSRKVELVAMLSRGAENFGYIGQIWTRARVGELIEREFGVCYHPNHVGKILKASGWTYQKPVSRASRRNDGAVR